MAKQVLSRRRKNTFRLIGALLSLTVVFLIGELATRIYYAVTAPQAIPPFDSRQLDDTYGWVTKPNYSYQGTLKDIAGVAYNVSITTDAHGFRLFGDTKAEDRKKVFFIGDSYTHSVEVSNDRTFYARLQDSLDIEAFAYGSGGYGTMQEYLILEKYIAEISPDVVILQLCANDLLDNAAQLERTAIYNIGKRRPYLNLAGEIVYETPLRGREVIKQYSTFLYFLRAKIGNMMGKRARPFSEKKIAAQGRAYEAYDYAVRVTEVLFQKIIALLPPETQLLVFTADNYRPQYDDFKQICAANDIHLVTEVVEGLTAAAAAGEIIRSADGYHWNEAGHEVVARALAPEIQALLTLDSID